MSAPLPSDRLLAIIQTQNEIAATALDLSTVMSLVVERAQSLTEAEAAVVELIDGDEIVYHLGRGTAAAHDGMRLQIESSLSGLCIREGRVLHCTDARHDDRVDPDACQAIGAISMVCVPLQHAARAVGVLKVYDERPFAFSEEDVATLGLLSGVIGAHMAHATDFEAFRHASRHDALTGLLNRRSFDERLDAELHRVSRHGGQLALTLLDLDRFKQINDTGGHAAGDAVLRAVAANLCQLRAEDAAYRLGGDEFALVLIETSAEGARVVIDRISSNIGVDPGCRGVGLSWGVATSRDNDDAASILARADAALYDAKRPLSV